MGVELEQLVAGAVVNSLFFVDGLEFSGEFLVVSVDRNLLVWKVEGDGSLRDHWEIRLPLQSECRIIDHSEGWVGEGRLLTRRL